MKARSLPSTVTLPISPIIEMGHLRIALADPSRQLLSVWRKHGFPDGWREGRQAFIATDTVSNWLQGQGVTVRRI
ncbi:hypothetical protein [Mesorhizobium sp. M00.F.Ca.ET.216.01.1.1]|uniref:hypothetical protein n=1 Tax=Mesorhizobium sp. M00.F.Ca.ET.216.01.1.1 TaxID=2500528 RepID=UPI000FDB2400|nr:hypothetical protein [Mesorhizobium sp. M00.F.Ca.ET.216.01.1.1]TGQ47612.1 hypothetical protein EN859_000015 [Mesorhizobium sp. M00.F.Ca.ET.216.01.1.1]